MRGLGWGLLLVGLAGPVLGQSPARPIAPRNAAADASGIPRIADGDTIEIGAAKIRLNGIDAPETDQRCFDAKGATWTCGIAARDALQRRFGGKTWTCKVTGQDAYKRSLASCQADGEDVQRWLVREGLALSFVRYAHTYDADEKAASEAKAGMWAGCFVAPWEWRTRSTKTVFQGSVCPVNRRKLVPDNGPEEAPREDCTIKGNTTRKGECIYHVLGQRFYTKVDMSPGRGRRWFCTRDEAEAAGCRASKI